MSLLNSFNFKQDCGLLKDSEMPSEKMTSNERAMRHGELKLLRSMKRDFQNAAPRKRTLLKVDPFEVCGGEEEEKPGVDIKDVEFRLRNDSSQLQVCCTLYPCSIPVNKSEAIELNYQSFFCVFGK